MSGLFLGIKTQNPVVGITSTAPGIANSMLSNPQINNPQTALPPQPTAQTIDSRWSNQGPTVVHEMPWHKAHPGLKNTK